MKKTLSLIIFIVIITVNTSNSQSCYSDFIFNKISTVTEQTVALLNRQLTGDTTVVIGSTTDTIKSRHYQQPGNQKAAQFIYEKFQSYGLDTYYWSFSAEGKNVIGKKTGVRYPNKQYIICAHYDDMPTGLIAPGADDNASGTVCVIEAARLFQGVTTDYTLLFIAFDEEERGLYGSKAYADTAYTHGDSIMGVLNLDMIAWDGNADNKIRIISNSGSVPFGDVNVSAAGLYVQNLVPSKVVSNMSGSDHYYFWQKGYKATCTIEDDFNPYYHTTNDKFSNVNVPYFHKVSQGSIAAFFVHALDYKMWFTHTPIANAQPNTVQTATAVINCPHPLAKTGAGAPRLYYKVNGGSYSYVNPSYSNLDTFRFSIPGFASGDNISYYIAAQDSLGRFTGTLPAGGKGVNPPGSTGPATVYTYSITTGIVLNSEPVKYELIQNYPNPFNPSTAIEFSLVKAGFVSLKVFDVLGRETAVILNNYMPAGNHTAMFDGSGLASGVYVYRLTVTDSKSEILFDKTRQMILKK